MKSKARDLAPTENTAMAIGEGLSWEAAVAWTFSISYIAMYLNEHAIQFAKVDDDEDVETTPEADEESSPNATALMAAGRLEWLLQATRPSLSGCFSERDIVVLLDCYQRTIFSPGEFDCIASYLCDHLGVELQDYRTSSIGKLVDTLLDLTAVQQLTLVDALEQTWHRGMDQEGQSPKEFLSTLGIGLS